MVLKNLMFKKGRKFLINKRESKLQINVKKTKFQLGIKKLNFFKKSKSHYKKSKFQKIKGAKTFSAPKMICLRNFMKKKNKFCMTKTRIFRQKIFRKKLCFMQKGQWKADFYPKNIFTIYSILA